MFGNGKTFERMRRHILILIAVVCVSILLSCSGDNKGSGLGNGRNGETLRFVFMADSRSDTHGDPPNPAAFINTPVLSAIVKQILALSPRPSFVVFGGDMVYRGHYADSKTSFYTFQAWKNVMKPLTDAGITVYTTMGNHELYDTHADNTFVLANQTEFQAEFTDNPTNGPPGYERLVYSFTSPGGDSFFAVLDPYYITATGPDTLTGNIDYTQLNWLAEQVAQTKATHKFLFIHTPYYYVTNTVPNASFTELWNILDRTNFDMFACGHSHLYSRKTIATNVAPNPQTYPPVSPWHNNVVQLICGTCGAPIDTANPNVDPSWHVFDGSNKPDTYYFSVVDIDGVKTTVNSYGYNSDTGTFSTIDTFRTQKNTSPQIVSQRRKGDKLAMFLGR